MLGMGLVGFFCGLIFHKKPFGGNRVAVGLVGGMLCFLIYGFTVDTCSVLLSAAEFNVGSAIGIYAAGLTFNIIHAVSTAVILFFISKPMNDKFSRLRIKYGVFGDG